jgi:hypothetical protein
MVVAVTRGDTRWDELGVVVGVHCEMITSSHRGSLLPASECSEHVVVTGNNEDEQKEEEVAARKWKQRSRVAGSSHSAVSCIISVRNIISIMTFVRHTYPIHVRLLSVLHEIEELGGVGRRRRSLIDISSPRLTTGANLNGCANSALPSRQRPGERQLNFTLMLPLRVSSPLYFLSRPATCSSLHFCDSYPRFAILAGSSALPAQCLSFTNC